MSRNVQGLYIGACFVLLGAFFAVFRWLQTGINEDFGYGFSVGVVVGAGLIFLASRTARESD